MENIVGLTEVLEEINSLKSLPNSFCLVGSEGSGKHTLAKYINNKFFDVEYLDITDTLNEETIDSIYRYPQKRLYIIDINKLTEKDQNKLLKFLEEPFANIYICLLANSELSLLSTIRNRVSIFKLDYYTFDELDIIAKNNNINIDSFYYGKCIFTPGDVLKVKTNNIDLKAIDELTDKIVNKLSVASFPNTLSIIDKLNFKGEYDKLDVDFVLSLLYNKYIWKYINNPECNGYIVKLAIAVSRCKTHLLTDPRLDKKKQVTSMLIELWEIEHGTQGTKKENIK